MENASKALIIAAAILIAIVLITLGVYVIGIAQDQMKSAGMSEIELTAFNQKFTKYDGKQKGSVIRTMVQDVISNNNGPEASDETRVSINVANGTGNTGTAVDSGSVDANLVTLEATGNAQPSFGANFSNTKTYTVTFKYKNGRIAVIQVH